MSEFREFSGKTGGPEPAKGGPSSLIFEGLEMLAGKSGRKTGRKTGRGLNIHNTLQEIWMHLKFPFADGD
ncbi:MAG: hypothetical protein EOM72_08370 [Opitutae bacterium]|nr:hypothetical protein [Opitutae bacterium]